MAEPTVNATKNTVQGQTDSTTTHHPSDASVHAPSELRKNVGPPSIEHEFPHDSSHKRHSISYQEQHFLQSKQH